MKLAKGDHVGSGILTYVGKPPIKSHVCELPMVSDDIPYGSVWWCLKCDWQWVLEEPGGGKIPGGWTKWRKAP